MQLDRVARISDVTELLPDAGDLPGGQGEVLARLGALLDEGGVKLRPWPDGDQEPIPDPTRIHPDCGVFLGGYVTSMEAAAKLDRDLVDGQPMRVHQTYSAYRTLLDLTAVERDRSTFRHRSVTNLRRTLDDQSPGLTIPINPYKDEFGDCEALVDLIATLYGTLVGGLGAGAVDSLIESVDPSCILLEDAHEATYVATPRDALGNIPPALLHASTVDIPVDVVGSTPTELKFSLPVGVGSSGTISVLDWNDIQHAAHQAGEALGVLGDMLGLPQELGDVSGEGPPTLFIVQPTQSYMTIDGAEVKGLDATVRSERCKYVGLAVLLTTEKPPLWRVAPCVAHKLRLYCDGVIMEPLEGAAVAFSDFLPEEAATYRLEIERTYTPPAGPVEVTTTRREFRFELHDSISIERLDAIGEDLGYSHTARFRISSNCCAGPAGITFDVAYGGDILSIRPPSPKILEGSNQTVVEVTATTPITSAAAASQEHFDLSADGYMTRRVSLTVRPPIVGLSLGGGGAKGSFQAGAISYLAQTGHLTNLDVIAGSSAGAINAVTLAQQDEIRVLTANLRDAWIAPESVGDMMQLDRALLFVLMHHFGFDDAAVAAAEDMDMSFLFDFVGGKALAVGAFVPSFLQDLTGGSDLAIESMEYVREGDSAWDKIWDDVGDLADSLTGGAFSASVEAIGDQIRRYGPWVVWGAAMTFGGWFLGPVAYETISQLEAAAAALARWNSAHQSIFVADKVKAMLDGLVQHGFDKRLRLVSISHNTGVKVFCDERAYIRINDAGADPLRHLGGPPLKFPGANVEARVIEGALASSAFPIAFPPRRVPLPDAVGVLEAHLLMDGGVRDLIPERAVAEADAEDVFTIALSPLEIDQIRSHEADAMSFVEVPARMAQLLAADVGQEDLAEVAQFERVRSHTVIAPRFAFVDTFEVDPTKSRINVAYGFMRAGDVVRGVVAGVAVSAENVAQARVEAAALERMYLYSMVLDDPYSWPRDKPRQFAKALVAVIRGEQKHPEDPTADLVERMLLPSQADFARLSKLEKLTRAANGQRHAVNAALATIGDAAAGTGPRAEARATLESVMSWTGAVVDAYAVGLEPALALYDERLDQWRRGLTDLRTALLVEILQRKQFCLDESERRFDDLPEGSTEDVLGANMIAGRNLRDTWRSWEHFPKSLRDLFAHQNLLIPLDPWSEAGQELPAGAAAFEAYIDGL